MLPTIEDLIQANSDYKSLKKFMCNKEYMNYLKESTNYLPDAAITKQRLWHLVNSEEHAKVCSHDKCNNFVTWNKINNSYRSFCSSFCAHNDPSVKEKIENTCRQKYGAKTYLVTKKAKDDYATTMIQKYGVDNPFKSEIVQQQIKDNLFEEFGVTNICQIPEIKEKMNQTHLRRYNRIRANQIHFSDESYNIKYDKQKLIELYDSGLTIEDIAKELNIGHSQLCIQFKNFGIEIHQAVGQTQLYNFIKSIYDDKIIMNDRKLLSGKEIDIFLPELNVGFEFDGMFWHSENSSGKTNYHYEKDVLAKTIGIKLFHITDFEWKNKQELVKSRISSLLGKNEKIYARKTEVKVLDKSIATIFFDNNHIQGNVGASFYCGLFYNETLVAAMSFGKSRYSKNQFELLRFCNLQNINVIGGASKLFKFAATQLNANDIISYSDIRWGTGNLYLNLGFEHIRDNKPSYSYTCNYRTFESRIKYQKHKLEKILPIYDKNLSEWENMKLNNFDRYWNSGNSVYVWTKK